MHELVHIGAHLYPTHYLQDVLDRLGGIDEFQVVQLDDRPQLRLVVPEVARRAAISEKIAAWWGDAVTLQFTDFTGLARRGWRSKFCHLVDLRAAS